MNMKNEENKRSGVDLFGKNVIMD